jgi:L-alanine-DL-glutamate epimerase-like enolase superfamily enzyme
MDAEGYFRPPSAPGLGIELDLEAVKRFQPVTGRPPAIWHDDGSVADW